MNAGNTKSDINSETVSRESLTNIKRSSTITTIHGYIIDMRDLRSLLFIQQMISQWFCIYHLYLCKQLQISTPKGGNHPIVHQPSQLHSDHKMAISRPHQYLTWCNRPKSYHSYSYQRSYGGGQSDGDRLKPEHTSRLIRSYRTIKEMGDKQCHCGYPTVSMTLQWQQQSQFRQPMWSETRNQPRKHPVQLLCEMYGKSGLQLQSEFLLCGPRLHRQKVTYMVMDEKFAAFSHTRDEAKRLCARKALLTLHPELHGQLEEEHIPQPEYNFGYRLNCKHPIELVRYFFKNQHVMAVEKKGSSHFTTYTVTYTIRAQKYVAVAEKQNEAKRRCAILVLNHLYNNVSQF